MTSHNMIHIICVSADTKVRTRVQGYMLIHEVRLSVVIVVFKPALPNKAVSSGVLVNKDKQCNSVILAQ